MKNLLFFMSVVFLFYGCYPRKKYTHGFTCEYYYLSTDKKRFCFDTISYSEIPKDSIYYPINGKTLRNELINHQKSLIYLWDPRCGGEYCYSLTWIESYCEKQGLKLFIIPIFIDTEWFDFNNKDIQTPITPIDFKHYRSIFCHKYIPNFLYDLGLRKSDKSLNNKGRYYWFEKDSLVNKTVEIKT